MRAIGAGVRIFEVLDRSPAIPFASGQEVSPHRQGPIKFENVRFHYPSRKGVQILQNLSLEVSVGETIAIV